MNPRGNHHPVGAARTPRMFLLIGIIALLPGCSVGTPEPDMNALAYPDPAWSPYLVGAAIGMLSWLTFYFSNTPIGASTFYAELAGLMGKFVAPRRTAALAYYKDEPPRLGWQFVFIVATIGGGALAALQGGEFANAWLPPMWTARFGDSIAVRAAVAFAGGILMACGARLAGGCTSGHGISGTLQLSAGSWLAVMCMFIGGIAVAMPLFKL